MLLQSPSEGCARKSRSKHGEASAASRCASSRVGLVLERDQRSGGAPVAREAVGWWSPGQLCLSLSLADSGL